jgi:molybdenum cofactor guanylyltransferase
MAVLTPPEPGTRLLGAIIAGGHSTRMGEDKAFLPLGNKPLLAHVISELQRQVETIVINANGDGARFATFGLAVIADEATHCVTPLAGLHGVLNFAKKAGFDAVITVPSDCPFLPPDLVELLAPAALKTGAAIARSGGQSHFLTGLWHVTLAAALDIAIRQDNLFRVKDWAAQCGAVSVDWPSGTMDPFFNINTKADLRLAEAFLHA